MERLKGRSGLHVSSQRSMDALQPTLTDSVPLPLVEEELFDT